MSRLPPISRKDLPDHASEERVERIWARVREDLPRPRRAHGAAVAGRAVAAIPIRSARPLLWFAAAAMTFATGLAVGKFSLSNTPSIEARPTGEGPMTDVFAAGSRQRTFSLPGGGRLVLEPDSLVEVVELSDTVVTLSLLRGAASVDTAELPIEVVAGEARVSAPAGSSVSLARRESDVDVLVEQGSVDVRSPAGHQVVKGGHVLQRVPTVTRVTLDNRPQDNVSQPMPVAIAPRDPAQTSPSALVADAKAPPVSAAEPAAPLVTAVEAPASASWKSLASAGQYKDAFALLEKAGGLEATIGSSQSAGELMYLSEVAAGNQKPALYRRALHRVADEFSADPNANVAASQLALIYEATNPQLAAKYREKAKQAKGSIAELALCGEVRAHLNMGEAADPAAAVSAASDYLKDYPLGSCAADARQVIEEMSGKVPPPSAGPYDDEKKDDKDKASKEKASKDESSKKKDGAPAASGSASAPAAPAPPASGSTPKAATPKAPASSAPSATPSPSKP